VPLSVETCRHRIRTEFEKNRNISDLRAIDLLVVKVKMRFIFIISTLCAHFTQPTYYYYYQSKGQMELVETAEIWKQRGHIMDYFNESNAKAGAKTDFLSKFLDNK
jgi:NADH dehydrogenase (ubiquinone) 1 alpha subcomplex subunit 6